MVYTNNGTEFAPQQTIHGYFSYAVIWLVRVLGEKSPGAFALINPVN